MIYYYACPYNQIENLKLLLSWRYDYTVLSKPQVYLLCTDLSLDLVTIQRYYEYWNGQLLFQGTAQL
ncbi:hypothetical protein GC093_18065 [Paenibacillus sp. LMG 31456]|uniref:Uncharacterized protein n=1 Tax=Paenibacillus foliorum TaxID=2654974 RepID=A0A972GYA6_9BACL|nr:hypothetical protein [Paenibacillus foliorum]NOU95115.1 hypothetical protein [Paenibacillus foliorum]